MKEQNTLYQRILFDSWGQLSTKVKDLGEIIQNDLTFAEISREDIETWVEAVQTSQKTLTHLANKTLLLVANEKLLKTISLGDKCQHCKCPLLDEGESSKVCENPACVTNKE